MVAACIFALSALVVYHFYNVRYMFELPDLLFREFIGYNGSSFNDGLFRNDNVAMMDILTKN